MSNTERPPFTHVGEAEPFGPPPASPEQTPAIGRIVHYVSYGTPGGEFLPEHRAAIIAGVTEPDGPGAQPEVDAQVCDLVVFNPQGLFFNRVPYSAEPKGGTWHWPERA
jgi:hypothetical protein